MSGVNRQTGEIVAVSADERNAVARLTTAITALSEAVDFMPINEVATLKAQVATIQTATRELGMSKEAQELAAEAVRRAEWALGRAMRKGQAEGSIREHGEKATTRNQHGGVVVQHDNSKASPQDYATRGELYGSRQTPGILAIADAAPTAERFDAALTEARAEGNLSRANVARKARESVDAEPTKPRRRPLPDAARDAGWDLRKSVERLERIATDDRFSANAEQVAPHLRSHLNHAIEVCQDLLARIETN